MKHTLLKYPGNKKSIAREISDVFDWSSVTDYWEPFCGSLGFSLNIEIPDNVRVHLSDVNWELINLYEQIFVHGEDVQKLALSWPTNEKTYYEIRDWDRSGDMRISRSALEIAARTLYLNKNCFNGLYRVNLRGQFNVPWKQSDKQAGFLSDTQELQQFLTNCSISCCDWNDVVSRVKAGDLVYCDPPYIDIKKPKENFNGYVKGFDFQEQVKLKDNLLDAVNRGAQVVVSNSWCNETRELYKDFNQKSIEARRSISRNSSGRQKVLELLAWL